MIVGYARVSPDRVSPDRVSPDRVSPDRVSPDRVSTPDQKLEAQIDLLKKEGCEKSYTDVASGTRDDRPGLREPVKYMRKGDTVITYKNDRVFRSLKNMVELIDKFNEIGVHFKSLSEPEFDTTSANGKFLLQIFAAVAETRRPRLNEI